MNICVDFDGVIHLYSKGWQNGSIYDPPVEGVGDAMQWLMRQGGHKIIIFSTRAVTQFDDMTAWLSEHGIPYTEIYRGEGKPKAHVYIDDRAIQFRGNWRDTVKEIGAFVPWNNTGAAKHCSGGSH